MTAVAGDVAQGLRHPAAMTCRFPLALLAIALSAGLARAEEPVVEIAADPSRLHGQAIAIDGFSLDLNDGSGERRRLRLISIDAPEFPKPGAVEARTALDDLLRPGAVDCTLLGEKIYQRELARCTAADGKDLGESLLRTGLVATARYFLFDRPWAQAYIDAEHAGLAARRPPAGAPETVASRPAAPTPAPVMTAPATAITASASVPPLPLPERAGFWDRNTKSEVLAAWIQTLGTIIAVLGATFIAVRRRQSRE